MRFLVRSPRKNPRRPMNARAVKADHLLEGEDPDTVFASDVRHWIAVYREMIGFNEELLGRLEAQVNRLPQAARDGTVGDDDALIGVDLELYQRRLGLRGRAGRGMMDRIVVRVAPAEALDFCALRLG